MKAVSEPIVSLWVTCLVAYLRFFRIRGWRLPAPPFEWIRGVSLLLAESLDPRSCRGRRGMPRELCPFCLFLRRSELGLDATGSSAIR